MLDDISLELLRRQGLSRDSIPDQGRNVIIHYNGDLTADVTDRMHPEVASQCALAARAIGLDIAGIDLISESIALPLEQIGGAIIEVNASPALGVHLKPLIGTPRPVGEAIIEHMFGAGSETRVPLIAVSRPGGGAPLCRALAHLLRARGGNPVVADRAGLSVGTRFLTRQDSTHATGHTRALMNPFVDSAILETSLPGLLSQGLAFDQCSVAVVAGQLSALENVEVANFGPFAQFTWPLTQTDRTRAVGVLVESVQGAGIAVLNADDPQFSALTAHCTGTVAYFGTEASQRSLEIHAQRGAIVGIVEGGSLWLWRSRQKHKVRSLAGMVTSNSATFNEVVADLAAAVVAAVAVGIDLASLEAGLDAALIELGLH